MLQDLLRPFLLACNHADASPQLMIMAMSSIQYLINRDAILPSDAPNILRCAVHAPIPYACQPRLNTAVNQIEFCHKPTIAPLELCLHQFRRAALQANQTVSGGIFHSRCEVSVDVAKLRTYLQRHFSGGFDFAQSKRNRESACFTTEQNFLACSVTIT